MIDALVHEAIGLADGARRAVLGVTGAPGAGKTTLVEMLVSRIAALVGPDWLAHVPMDGFHLADSQLRRLGALDRKGAPDTFDAAGYAHLLARVRSETDSPVYAPGFERTLEQPISAELVVLPEARLVITEGNYLLLDDPAWAAARASMDTVWYVTGDEELRVERLVARHIQFGKSPEAARTWVAGTDQRNADQVSASRVRADRVIVNGPDGWRVTG